MHPRVISSLLVTAVSVLASASASASLILYGQNDRDAWFADVESAETITFAEHHPTILTTQYELSHGLTIQGSAPASVWTAEHPLAFLNDGIGMVAAGGPAWLLFDRDMHAFAVDFPGAFMVDLYDGEILLHEINFGSSGEGLFRGIMLEGQTFDRVRIHSNEIAFFVDDLHFAAIPAPAAWVMLAMGCAFGTRRRRGCA